MFLKISYGLDHWLTLLSQPRVSPDRMEVIRRSIGSWCFSAHDFTDEELVVCASLMLEHALQVPGVEEFRIPSGMSFSVAVWRDC